MDTSILENIGLNTSEIKVYLALLKLGASKTGAIIKESKTADSKIYEVLGKLVEKGLVSFFKKEDLNYYKAENPQRILDYLREKKEGIEKQEYAVSQVLPQLLAVSSANESEKEAVVYAGRKGMRTAFSNLVDEMKTGEEVHIMGVHNFGANFKPTALFFQNIRSKKGIKAKFLINEDAKEIAMEFSKYKPVEIRFLDKNVFTPAVFLIYHDKVLINLADELTMFLIKSKSTAVTFEAYFKSLWGKN
jgi:sugar-specific transcriptional regulator TrmB